MFFRWVSSSAAFLAAILVFGSSVFETDSAQAKSSCKNTGSFDRWLINFEQTAVASGISQRIVRNALRGIEFDPRIIKKDRAQVIFSDDWLTFAGKLISANRLKVGADKLKANDRMFREIERKYGVPGAVVTAFWALETDFGGFMGRDSTIRSLATLAYDCRRPEKFNPELLAALRLIEKGDVKPEQMVGAWAGEIGQLQFLPSYYDKHGVDFNGDGRRDMVSTAADALASAANYMKYLGWQAGQPWLEEVEVPASMPWEQADVAIKHSRAQWAKWGVRQRGGKPLRSDEMQASLILPMGRNGPAFLGYPNFDAYLTWNESLIYSLTAAYLGTRLAGAPRVNSGRANVESMGYEDVRQVQSALARRGYDVGGVDGTLGAKTRAAVRDMQLKLGMPADGYPTPEFVRKIR